MLVGRPPFQGMSQYLIFEKIRLGQIEFPQDIDLQGKDFIEKLLVQDPDLRLGCGPIGSDNDLDALREHPFISSISHSDIFNLPVPWENWPEKPKPGSEGSESDDDDIEVKLLNMSGIEKDPKQEESKKNLKPEPMILVSGVIKKKCGWFYKKRYLIVSSEPRIYYTDANNLQKVREIALSKDLVAELKHGNDFVINNPQRSYFFREMIGNPERWVEGINNIIKANFGE
jgi:3-phosphoinositide dependent protein kinase-1